MEHKNTYTGRTPSGAQRKPSGFSAAGQAPKRSAPQPMPEAKPPKKQKIKKEKTRRVRGERKGGILKRVLLGGLIALLIALILLVVFGDRGTYHQMPTITREEPEGSFDPEVTPMPGVEEAI